MQSIKFDKLRKVLSSGAKRFLSAAEIIRRIMNKEFFMGLALGMIGGALIVVNSKKAKDLIEKGQKEVTKQIKKAKQKKEKTDQQPSEE